MSPALLALLAGCGSEAPVQTGPVDVRVWATDVTAAGGLLVVQTSTVDGVQVSLPEPAVDGLTFTPEPPIAERLGARTVVTQKFRFAGKKGSYEIPALTVEGPSGPVTSLPVWVDLGVEVSDFGTMADIEDPSQIWTIPWGWICGVGALGALGLGGLVVAFGRVARPAPRVAKREPPDVRCLRAWEAVRADTSRTDEDKARDLSLLFREYVQEVLGFPAVSWTTSEILERLDGMVHLPKGNVPRAKTLLRATDLVKYAELPPDADAFDQLDSELRAFVGSTRPQAWTGEPPPAPPPEGVPRG